MDSNVRYAPLAGSFPTFFTVNFNGTYVAPGAAFEYTAVTLNTALPDTCSGMYSTDNVRFMPFE